MDDHKKYISIVLTFIIIGFAFAIIFPFFLSIITSAITAYIFYPLFLKINSKIKKKGFSSFITTLIIVLLIILPLIAIINGIAFQTKNVYSIVSDKISDKILSNYSFFNNFQATLQEKFGLEFNLKEIFSNFTFFITNFAKDFLTSLPNRLIQIFLFLYLTYYFFKEGDFVVNYSKNLLPLNKKSKDKIIHKINELTKAIIYGSIVTAGVQGIIGGIGFLIFGINSPLFWGFMMAIFALIPFIGTGIIWLPASLFLMFNGYINHNPILIGKGVGLILYGTFVISLVDNFIKPFLISGKGKMHPALIVIGILGGLSLFGFIGIIMGPLIIALFLSLVEIYREENKN